MPQLAGDLSNINAWFPSDAVDAAARIDAIFTATAAQHNRIAASYGSIAVAQKDSFLVHTDTDGREYRMNHLYLPAPSGKARQTFVFDAGVHGAEGAAGEAAIELFLREKLGTMDPQERARTNILLLHSVNPWGRAHGYRFDQDKVDNNRQGLAKTDAERLNLQEHGVHEPYSFQTLPPSDFKKVEGFFTPKRPLGSIFLHKCRVLIGMVAGLLKLRSYDGLVQAMAGGQYGNPKGTIFGGTERQAVIDECERLIVKAVSGVDQAIHYSFHTGLGERNRLHMIENSRAEEDRAFGEQLLGNAERSFIRTNVDSPGFYDVAGDITRLTERALKRFGRPSQNGERPKGAYFTVEWGTLGNAWYHKLETTQIFSAMNRYFQQGGRFESTGARVQALSRRLFDPDPAVDRANGTEFRTSVVRSALDAFSALPGFDDSSEEARLGRFAN